MAVEWTEPQESAVEELLRAYPLESRQCAALARGLLPVARERDGDAHGLLIKPKPGTGRFVVPRTGARQWHHHATVSVEDHCVDALTGKWGTQRSHYLAQHWQHADCLHVERDALEDPCP